MAFKIIYINFMVCVLESFTLGQWLNLLPRTTPSFVKQECCDKV